MDNQTILFSAGKGPVECAMVVAQALKILMDEAQKAGLLCRVLHKQPGEQNGTIQSVLVHISGKGCKHFLEGWTGTLQWIGRSPFRQHHQRKNWFIGCSLITDNTQVLFDEKQVRYQTIRSSGPGGQHVNKVSTAVRATYAPSGIQVLASDSRSQLENKKKALARLKEKVQQYNLDQQIKHAQHQWKQHLQLERGNPVRTFEGSDFKKIKEDRSYKKERLRLKQNLKKTYRHHEHE